MPIRPHEVPPVDGLWEHVISPEALLRAFQNAARGKRRRPDVAAFAWDQGRLPEELRERLASGAWEPAGDRQFELVERKRRVISVAPFADRVVHHALMAVVEPVLDARMYPHSYACRTGKGTHAAVAWYQRKARRHAYALKLDLARYFPSFDQACLKQSLWRALSDQRVLRMLDRLIDSGGTCAGALGWAWPGEDLVDQWRPGSGIRGMQTAWACAALSSIRWFSSAAPARHERRLARRVLEQQTVQAAFRQSQQESPDQPQQQYRVPFGRSPPRSLGL